MHVDSTDRIEPAVLTIQGMLTKVDRLHLPSAIRLAARSGEYSRSASGERTGPASTVASRSWTGNSGDCTPHRTGRISHGRGIASAQAGLSASRYRRSHASTLFANQTRMG